MYSNWKDNSKWKYDLWRRYLYENIDEYFIAMSNNPKKLLDF